MEKDAYVLSSLLHCSISQYALLKSISFILILK